MIKLISIDHPQVVNYAVNILKKGGVIVYPTDTLYGFGADATDDGAIDKINRIKGRSGPMSVIAANNNMAVDWMNITCEQLKITKPYLGGSQTLIVPVKDNIVSSKILGEKNTLGVRIPKNTFCNDLSLQFDKPIISTSVNRTNEQPMNDPIKIESKFSSEINLLIDAGTLPKSKGSTIYQLKENKIIILRT
jgi:tRNA threonylcarbamoyl adenosine modification protein (Sua5/YciO/YrdC/YwlC family)